MIKQKKQLKAKSHKPIPVLDFEVERSTHHLPSDYFVLLFPINSLMTLILTLLMVSAIDPEDYSIIPGLRENKYAQGGWIAGCLFAFLLFINLVTTLQVIKLCEKHALNSTTTTKWIGQTLISGVLSWKVLKDADNLTHGDESNKLASVLGMEDCLVGPFFLTCNKCNKSCRHTKHNEKVAGLFTRSDPNVKHNKGRNMKNTHSTPNVYANFRQNKHNLRSFPKQNNRTNCNNWLVSNAISGQNRRNEDYSPYTPITPRTVLSSHDSRSEVDDE